MRIHMKLIILISTLFFTLASNATVFCKGEQLQIQTIITDNVDVLNELYNGESYSEYDGVVCGVEDTSEICFTGSDRNAAFRLQRYFEHAYQHDDGTNRFFVQFRNGDFNSVTLRYREQGSSIAFQIKKCN